MREKMEPHLSDTGEILTQHPTMDDTSRQNDVGGTSKPPCTHNDAVSVEILDHPLTSDGQDMADNVCNTMNIEDLISPSSGNWRATEKKQIASEKSEAALSSLEEDFSSRRLSVDAVVGDTCTQVSGSMSAESKSVVTDENVVLQSLLRKYRYFDFGSEAFHSEGHASKFAVGNWKKPCYICGGSEHTGRKCRKRRTCHICKARGHLAADCPKTNPEYIPICLKCGESGHELFSCNHDYNDDDLKKIQCYICKELGHICCGSYEDTNPATVSCYNCGESGHSGMICPKPCMDKRGARPPSACYKCGGECHFARKCGVNNLGEDGHTSQNRMNDPKAADLNSTSQSSMCEDRLEMVDFASEPINGDLSERKKKARRYKTYRYGRAKKRKMKGLQETASVDG